MNMVTYESAKSVLTLNYEGATPSAGTVIDDILNAPIEQGPNFQNKRRRRDHSFIPNERTLVVRADLGKKALKEVIECPTIINAGFKLRKTDDGSLAFDIPEMVTENLQTRMMR